MILKFDLNETGSFNSGLLKLNMVKGDAPINPEGDEVKLYAISNDWTESEVTYNNQPELGELVATTIVNNPVGWYTWDITSYLKEHQEEGTVSFMLIGTNVNRMINYRESGEKTSPRIILDTDETAPQCFDVQVSHENTVITMNFDETIMSVGSDIKSNVFLAAWSGVIDH